MRLVEVAGKGIGGKAVAQRIGDPHRVLDGVIGDDPGNGAKGLFGHEAAVGGGVGDDGGLEEEAGPCDALAAGDDFAAVAPGIGDHRLHCRNPAGVGKRAHIDALIRARITDLELAGTACEFGDEGLVNRLVDKKARGRDADLPGIAELGRGAHRHRTFEIGVLADDHRGMSAEFRREALHVVCGQRAQLLADRGRSGEADLAGNA